MADHAPLAADLFITRVVRTAWASAKPPGDPHERSIRVPRCPVTYLAIVTQLDTQADRRSTISLGMIVTVSLDLPKRRSARILTSPRVTVSPRNRPPYRARNGHAYGSGGRRCRLANLCAGLARRRCCRADSEDRSAYVSDHAHRGAAAHSCSADHPGARAGRMADLPSIVQRYITSTWPRGRCRKRPS
jgi:hypothetical protein